MLVRFSFAALLTLLPAAVAQNTPAAPQAAQTTKATPPKPAVEQAPGAAPDKVWLNAKSNVYHCPGDRYYGKTKDGKYISEPDAKKAGAHGARNQTCFK